MIGRLVLVNPIGAHLKEEKNLIWRLEGVSEDTLEPYHLGIYIIFLNTLHLLASPSINCETGSGSLKWPWVLRLKLSNSEEENK